MATYLRRNATFHLSEDRLDRVVFIATEIGYGNVIKEKLYHDETRGTFWRQLTDTGVLIVRTEDKNKVITLWLANINQATETYNGARLPQYVYNRILKNRKYEKMM